MKTQASGAYCWVYHVLQATWHPQHGCWQLSWQQLLSWHSEHHFATNGDYETRKFGWGLSGVESMLPLWVLAHNRTQGFGCFWNFSLWCLDRLFMHFSWHFPKLLFIIPCTKLFLNRKALSFQLKKKGFFFTKLINGSDEYIIVLPMMELLGGLHARLL